MALAHMITQTPFHASPYQGWNWSAILRLPAKTPARTGQELAAAGPGPAMRTGLDTIAKADVASYFGIGEGGCMRYRPLGNSGLVVSVVGLGCNNFGRRLNIEQTRAVVDAAIDAGVTLLDTAETYGGRGRSEELLGEVLAGRREQVVLATKFGAQGSDMGYGPAAGAKGGRAYVRRAVEQSLRRLRTDYIDLYQMHTPDPVTPIEETLAALSELVRAGLVRYTGHSNFSGAQLAAAAAAASELNAVPFISAQNHWSLLERQAELDVVPTAVKFGLGVLPFFPLANGLLTGKVRRGVGPAEGTRLAEPGRLHHRCEAGQGRGAG